MTAFCVRRLFVAIDLDGQVKDALIDAIAALKAVSTGRFVRRENLHLTLAFIGETERTHSAVSALEGLSFSPFSLTVGRVGFFKRQHGDICWAGVSKSEPLKLLAGSVAQRLKKSGFDIESRAYRPHITLGREVFLNGPPPALPPLTMTVRELTLFESTRQNASLVYRPVYRKEASS